MAFIRPIIVTAGTRILSWDSVSGTSYYVIGWDTISHSGGDVYTSTLYPVTNWINVGTSLSWTNNTGQNVYASVFDVNANGEHSAWGSEKYLLA